MKVLVIGRHASLMSHLLRQMRQAGFEVTGVDTDAEALALIQQGHFEVVTIGGGVEPPSRAAFKAEAQRQTPSPTVLEIYGPDTLLPRLVALRDKATA